MKKDKKYPSNYNYSDYLFAHQLHSRPGNLFYPPDRFLSLEQFSQLRNILHRYMKEFDKQRRNRRSVNVIMSKIAPVNKAINAVSKNWKP